jgi:hypothetical protein
MDEVLHRFSEDDDLHVLYALRLPFLCAEFIRLLTERETVETELNLGGADRISLRFWDNLLNRCGSLSVKEFVLLLLVRPEDMTAERSGFGSVLRRKG